MALRVGLALLAYVLCVNGLVRALGDGYPHPLSPRRMPEKTAALAALGVHGLGHLLGGHGRPADAIVREAARRRRVSEKLLLSIARVESDLRPHRISHTGAMGLMQLMPDTAAAYGVSDPFDPLQSALGAASFVKQLSRRYAGEARRIAAAYNAGPGRVPRRGPLHLPDETRSYVHRVLRQMRRITDREHARPAARPHPEGPTVPTRRG